MKHLAATLAIFLGSVATIFNLLDAFGVDLSEKQQGAISDAAGLALIALGAWFHPEVPIGRQKEEADGEGE